MARTNQAHLERARAKLNELHEHLEQEKARVIAEADKAIAAAKARLAKLEAKLDSLKIE